MWPMRHDPTPFPGSQRQQPLVRCTVYARVSVSCSQPSEFNSLEAGPSVASGTSLSGPAKAKHRQPGHLRITARVPRIGSAPVFAPRRRKVWRLAHCGALSPGWHVDGDQVSDFPSESACFRPKGQAFRCVLGTLPPCCITQRSAAAGRSSVEFCENLNIVPNASLFCAHHHQK